MSSSVANAADMIKDYHAYRIKNQKMQTILPIMETALTAEDFEKVSGTPNAYFTSYNGEHYYMKFYQALKDTDVYLVTDGKYDKQNNGLTGFFKSQGYAFEDLEDNDAYKEYKNDFVEFARTGALDGFFYIT